MSAVEGVIDSSVISSSSDSSNRWWKDMKLPGGVQLSSVAAHDWVHARRSNLRPWTTFGATSNFKSPLTLKRWSTRLAKNVEYFQSNYLFVSIGLIIYCLLTSPLLLLVLAALFGGCYLATLRQAERPLAVAGKTVPLPHQYLALTVAASPLFYISGAGAAIFWVVAASLVVVLTHASAYDIEAVVGDEEAPFDMQVEEV